MKESSGLFVAKVAMELLGALKEGDQDEVRTLVEPFVSLWRCPSS